MTVWVVLALMLGYILGFATCALCCMAKLADKEEGGTHGR